MNYVLEIKGLGYYAHNQKDYSRNNFTQDVQEAKIWKTKKGASEQGELLFSLAKDPVNRGRPWSVQPISISIITYSEWVYPIPNCFFPKEPNEVISLSKVSNPLSEESIKDLTNKIKTIIDESENSIVAIESISKFAKQSGISAETVSSILDTIV